MFRSRNAIAAVTAVAALLCLNWTVRADDPPKKQGRGARTGRAGGGINGGGKANQDPQDKNGGDEQGGGHRPTSDPQDAVKGDDQNGKRDVTSGSTFNVMDASFEMIGQRLAGDLQLTPEQQAQFEQIRSKYHDEMRNARTAGNDDPDGMKRHVELLEKARANGDEATMNKLKMEMTQLTQQRLQAANALRDRMLDEVQTILTPEQQQRFSDLRTQYAARSGPRMMVNQRLLRQTVSRLPLGPEQKSRIAALFDHFRDEVRPATGKATPQEHQAATMRLTEAVMKELTEEQRTQLHQMLQAARPAQPGGQPGQAAQPKQP